MSNLKSEFTSETLIFLDKLAQFQMRKARKRVASIITSDEWPKIVANFPAIYEMLSKTLDKWSTSCYSGILPKEIVQKNLIVAKNKPRAKFASHLTPNFIRGRIRALQILFRDAKKIMEKYQKCGGKITNNFLSAEEEISLGYIVIFCLDIDEYSQNPFKFEMKELSPFLLKLVISAIVFFIIIVVVIVY